jgi:hypothetical protein
MFNVLASVILIEPVRVARVRVAEAGQLEFQPGPQQLGLSGDHPRQGWSAAGITAVAVFAAGLSPP